MIRLFCQQRRHCVTPACPPPPARNAPSSLAAAQAERKAGQSGAGREGTTEARLGDEETVAAGRERERERDSMAFEADDVRPRR